MHRANLPGSIRSRSSAEQGYTLVVTAIGLAGVIGMAGLGIDVGRMYVARTEVQTLVDGASIAAALQLDGTSQGIARAVSAVNTAQTGSSAMKWDMGTKLVSSVTTEFAKGLAAYPNSPDGSSWDTNPANPVDYRFVRVTGSVDVPTALIFAFKSLQSGTATRTASVEARAIAAQAMITTYTQGLLPFSQVGHNSTPDNFGLTPTVLYTLRFPSPNQSGQVDACPGDVGQAFIDQLPSEDRGYWGSNSAKALRGEIIDDYQVHPISIGDPVPMVGGAKNTEGDALNVRVLEDSDPDSETYADYLQNGRGNGRRVIGAPINNGPPDFIAVGSGASFS